MLTQDLHIAFQFRVGLLHLIQIALQYGLILFEFESQLIARLA